MSEMALERQREFTVTEYHGMVEAGIIAHDERVELLEGRVVEMPPIGLRHWNRHATIVAYLNATLANRALVVGQGSFPLGTRSEPQPDIAILPCRSYETAGLPPQPTDIYAVIELADSSLRTDLGLKLKLYARHGIADYVVVDLEGDRLLYHTEPHALGYRKTTVLERGGAFALSALPSVTLSATPFLRPET